MSRLVLIFTLLLIATGGAINASSDRQANVILAAGGAMDPNGG